jgi:hypothetical protein
VSDESTLNRWGVLKLAVFSDRKTLREVDPADLPADAERCSPGSFGEALQEFAGRVLPTDKLYHYDSYREEWDNGFGSEGYIIVREGELLDGFLLCMN